MKHTVCKQRRYPHMASVQREERLQVSNMFSREISRKDKPEKPTISLPSWLTDINEPAQKKARPTTQESKEQEKKTVALPSWLTDTFRKNSSLDENSKITDFFKGSKPHLPTCTEYVSERSVSTKSDDGKGNTELSFCEYIKHRKMLANIENLQEHDGASSQRSAFGTSFKYPSAVSYPKNTLSDLAVGFTQTKNNFRSFTFSCLTKKNTDCNSQCTTNSSGSGSQDIFTILTPEETSSKNRTSSSENAFLRSQSQTENISQDMFSSSSDSVPNAQASQKSQKLTAGGGGTQTKRNKPAVNCEEVPECHFEDNATEPKKRKPRGSRVKFAEFNIDNSAKVEEWQRQLAEGMKKIKEAEAVAYERLFESGGWPLKPNKDALIARISNVLDESERTGIIIYRKTCYSNCVFSENRLLMRPFETAYKSFIQCNSRQTNSKFLLTRILLAKIKSLLESDSSVTQRALYYQFTNFVKKQEQVSSALLAISRILDVGPWELRIFNTNKGLVHGDLKLICEDDEIVNCNVAAGVLIPQNVDSILRFETRAEFVIVVEKDTIFQKLLDEDFRKHMPVPFILITGKGYPDTNTRLFLNKLYSNLKLPVFLLVDANPFGIDIMLGYRIGTLAFAHLSHLLTLPNLKWLGVFPSEVQTLNLVRQKLTVREVVKIEQILQRDYMVHFPKIQKELMIMKNTGEKSEIEGVIKTNDFLSQVYLPRKFDKKDYM